MSKIKALFVILFLPLIMMSCTGITGNSCTDDLDCVVGSICFEGICQGGDECEVDSDCGPPPAICEDSICF